MNWQRNGAINAIKALLRNMFLNFPTEKSGGIASSDIVGEQVWPNVQAATAAPFAQAEQWLSDLMT
jgi:hypothetical protein